MAIEFDKSKFEVSKSEGVATVTYTGEKVFMEGTDIPATEVKAVFKYAEEFIEAGTVAATAQATAIMDKDSKIDVVNVELPYGISKRGAVNLKAKRSHTYPGIGDRPDVTKSTLSVAVKDPATKMSKTKVKALEAEMTKKLLG